MSAHLHLDIKCKQRKRGGGNPPVCPQQQAKRGSLNGAARSNIIQMSLALSSFLHRLSIPFLLKKKEVFSFSLGMVILYTLRESELNKGEFGNRQATLEVKHYKENIMS